MRMLRGVLHWQDPEVVPSPSTCRKPASGPKRSLAFQFLCGMGHWQGAGTTEPAPVGPAGDAGPIKPPDGTTNLKTRILRTGIHMVVNATSSPVPQVLPLVVT